MEIFVLLGLCLAFLASAVAEPSLKLGRPIALPGVAGRIDHFSIDDAGARLFVAALGNNTVEVVDLHSGRVVRSLAGFAEPQGVLYVPAFNRLYVANGGDGTLRIMDGTTFAPVTVINLEDDADNVRYDPAAQRVYVGCGSGALAIVDAARDALVASVPLSAHPEGFELDPAGKRAYVNVPRSAGVAVVDLSTQTLAATWSLGRAGANFPMALDQANHRAFVGCRAPSGLLVLDTTSGRVIARLELHGDCDDLFYDASRHRLYAACGEGYIDVFTQLDADHLTLRDSVHTPARARTAFLAGSSLYLAKPKRGAEPAEILCYEISP